jgi:hypothetical protein
MSVNLASAAAVSTGVVALAWLLGVPPDTPLAAGPELALGEALEPHPPRASATTAIMAAHATQGDLVDLVLRSGRDIILCSSFRDLLRPLWLEFEPARCVSDLLDPVVGAAVIR